MYHVITQLQPLLSQGSIYTSYKGVGNSGLMLQPNIIITMYVIIIQHIVSKIKLYCSQTSPYLYLWGGGNNFNDTDSRRVRTCHPWYQMYPHCLSEAPVKPPHVVPSRCRGVAPWCPHVPRPLHEAVLITKSKQHSVRANNYTTSRNRNISSELFKWNDVIYDVPGGRTGFTECRGDSVIPGLRENLGGGLQARRSFTLNRLGKWRQIKYQYTNTALIPSFTFSRHMLTINHWLSHRRCGWRVYARCLGH